MLDLSCSAAVTINRRRANFLSRKIRFHQNIDLTCSRSVHSIVIMMQDASAPTSPSPAGRSFKRVNSISNSNSPLPQASRSISGFFSGMRRKSGVEAAPGKIALPIESSPSRSSPHKQRDDTGSIYDKGDDVPTLLPGYSAADYSHATPLPLLR